MTGSLHETVIETVTEIAIAIEIVTATVIGTFVAQVVEAGMILDTTVETTTGEAHDRVVIVGEEGEVDTVTEETLSHLHDA